MQSMNMDVPMIAKGKGVDNSKLTDATDLEIVDLCNRNIWFIIAKYSGWRRNINSITM